MRRAEFAQSSAHAVELLSHAAVHHLAGVTEAGEPVLKTVHGVVVDGWLCFHAAPAGEKTSLLRRPVVVGVEEVVAQVPSYFTDPERACPATTLYRAAQTHGVLEPIDEPTHKARVLQALMEKLQPEGGHRPLTAEDPLYAPAVRGLLIAGLRLDHVTRKDKLAQNKRPAEVLRLVEALWRRGAPGDARAIGFVLAANVQTPTPSFLAAPSGFALHPHPGHGWAEQVVELLRGTYWNDVFTDDDVRRAHEGSAAWVGATDREGRLVASARAVSDGGKHAWVYDVVVAPELRGRGLGRALCGLLLDHPAVRRCRRVWLGTRDAQRLYASFGFVPRSALPPRPYATTEMVLLRGPVG